MTLCLGPKDHPEVQTGVGILTSSPGAVPGQKANMLLHSGISIRALHCMKGGLL